MSAWRDVKVACVFISIRDRNRHIEQSVTMEAALKKAGVDVKFVRVPGGKHGRNFGFAADDPRLPSYLDTVAQWFDAYLK